MTRTRTHTLTLLRPYGYADHRMRARRPIPRLLLVAVALAAIAAHICVVPGHVHAAPIANGHAHQEPAGDHPSSDGVHAASCEALRPATAVPAALLLGGRTIDVLNGVAPDEADRASVTPTPTSSPPLYLTHRALLI